jgi:arginyl-tRNA synthetase
MSKRAGHFVTLADVVREGRQGRGPLHDAHPPQRAPLDFDFAKVVEASKDNPVFYVQYAHARIRRSTARQGGGGGLARRPISLLDEDELAR